MLAIRRTVKKTTYAVIFFSILFSLTALIIVPRLPWEKKPGWANLPPPPEAVMVEKVDIVSREDTLDVVARIRNPNPRAGVMDFPVTFVLLGEDSSELGRYQEKTYLLPGSLHYVAKLGVSISAPVLKVKVEVPQDLVFASLPSYVSLPPFNSFLRDRTVRTIGSRSIETQKGVVINTGTLGWRRVDITGVAFDAEGNVIGVGRTFLGNMKVGEQREFSLQWPAPSPSTQRVIVLPSTNVFDEDNILKIGGDPGSLR